MSLFQFSFDSGAQATLDRLSHAIGLLTAAIQQQGSKTLAAIDNLTAELTKFTTVEATLAAAVQAVATALQNDATKIADLTAQLAASSDPAILALLPQFDAIADKLSADATTLQGAVPTSSTKARRTP